MSSFSVEQTWQLHPMPLSSVLADPKRGRRSGTASAPRPTTGGIETPTGTEAGRSVPQISQASENGEGLRKVQSWHDQAPRSEAACVERDGGCGRLGFAEDVAAEEVDVRDEVDERDVADERDEADDADEVDGRDGRLDEVDSSSSTLGRLRMTSISIDDELDARVLRDGARFEVDGLGAGLTSSSLSERFVRSMTIRRLSRSAWLMASWISGGRSSCFEPEGWLCASSPPQAF